MYKNVDIEDLMSIKEKGLLSMEESGNFNWEDGKRGSNATDVVYLFRPTTEINSFPHYGAALVSVDIEGAQLRELGEGESPRNVYEEYTVDWVNPRDIKGIYIPEIFRNRIDPDSIPDGVEWCGFEAEILEEYGFESKEQAIECFAQTAPLNSGWFNFFRGIAPNRTMIDVREVRYIF